MKIGILTFQSAINYGAILQTYALKEVLCQMGHEVHVIDYKPHYITESYRILAERPGLRSLTTFTGWKLWYRFIKVACRRFVRKSKFKDFARKNFSLDKTQTDDLASSYDVVICGSDQIWNPNITGGALDDVFFGKLVEGKTSKVISYAASVGSIEKLNAFKDDFAAKLKNFSAISVRENNLSDYISSITGGHISSTIVVDPTILAGREVFESLIKERLVEKPYLLYFDLANINEFRVEARRIAREKGLEFVELTTYHDYVSGQKLYKPASPTEFCSLIKYADLVVTTSFHGTVFSILFNRLFVSYSTSFARDRFKCLLNDLGISERLVQSSQDFDSRCNELFTAIDYELVNNKLAGLKEKSLKWLESSLK